MVSDLIAAYGEGLSLMLMGRTLTAATLATSLLVYGRLLSGQYVIFYLPWVFMKLPPQLWRIVTSFWLTDPGLSILLDPYFRELELSSSLNILAHRLQCIHMAALWRKTLRALLPSLEIFSFTSSSLAWSYWYACLAFIKDTSPTLHPHHAASSCYFPIFCFEHLT